MGPTHARSNADVYFGRFGGFRFERFQVKMFRSQTCVQKLPVIFARKPHGLAAVNILKKHSKALPNQIVAPAEFESVETI